MTRLEYLQVVTKADADVVEAMAERAEAFALSYTNRTTMIPQLENAVRDLAIIYINRMGTEGEKGRSEAGESYTFEEAPKQVYDVLNRFRLARVGGVVYANEAEQN